MLRNVKDAESARRFAEEARAMIKKYGWEERKVYPYSFGVNVLDIVRYADDYDNQTEDSKAMTNDLVNGLVRILNKWEEYANEPKVEVMINGKKVLVSPVIAEALKDIDNEKMERSAEE